MRFVCDFQANVFLHGKETIMKKILYYTAQVLLLLCSLMLGFVNSTEMMILCVSSLICGLLLITVYSVMTKRNALAFLLYATVVCTHAFYLASTQAFAPILLAGMTLMMVCALSVLIYMSRRDLPIGDTLEDVLFAKAALIPEIMLNYLMSKSSGDSMFIWFSWLLLAYTSLCVFAVIWKMLKAKELDQSKAIAAGLLQCFFFTDILSCSYLIIHHVRFETKKRKEEEEARASYVPLYKKASFSKSAKKHMPQNTKTSALRGHTHKA